MSDERRAGERIREWMVSALLAIAAAAAAYGALVTRVSEVQIAEQKQSERLDSFADQRTDIAVLKSQYAEIIRRLDMIDRKLGEPTQDDPFVRQWPSARPEPRSR